MNSWPRTEALRATVKYQIGWRISSDKHCLILLEINLWVIKSNISIAEWFTDGNNKKKDLFFRKKCYLQYYHNTLNIISFANILLAENYGHIDNWSVCFLWKVEPWLSGTEFLVRIKNILVIKFSFIDETKLDSHISSWSEERLCYNLL